MSLIFASGMPLRISFSVSIVVYDVPNTRCGPTGWLNRVPCGSDAGDVTSGFRLSRASAGSCDAAFRNDFMTAIGRVSPWIAARRSSSASLGIGSGSHS